VLISPSESAFPSIPGRPPTNTRIHLLMAALYPLMASLPFPPFNWHWLSAVAITPLVIIAGTKPRRLALLAAFAGGTIFFYINLRWLRFYAVEGLLLLPAYLALYPWLFCLIVAKLDKARPGAFLWSAPFVWTGLELIRGKLLGGFGWYELGQGTWGLLPVIQIADLGGVSLVSLVVAAVGTALAGILVSVFCLRGDGVPRRSALAVATCVSAVVLAASVAYGSWRLGQEATEPGPKVCVVQPNFPMVRGTITEEPADIIRTMVDLSTDALEAEPDVDLVVWPETMVPGELRLEIIPAFRRKAPMPETPTGDSLLEWSNALARYMRRTVSGELKCATLVGWHVGRPSGKDQPAVHYNSAVLLSPDGVYVDRYDKIHLVPFGEFTPLKRFLPFVVRLIEDRVGEAPNLTSGKDSTVFSVRGVPFGATICYEDTFPYLTRRLVRRGARFMVNLTNDAWFENSPELDMHAAVCVFRAVENRIPVARAANTGISCIIDSAGRIVKRVEDRFGFYRQVEGTLVGRLHLDGRRTLYTDVGDLVGWVCVALTMLAVVVLVRLHTVRKADQAKAGATPAGTPTVGRKC